MNSSRALSLFAKLVVVATLWLILIGSHTTTAGAGMAFPDWPLSRGELNPSGWWRHTLERLEHGHRQTAEAVGLLIGILCAWVWRSKIAIPLAFATAAAAAAGTWAAGLTKPIVVHVFLWTSAAVFVVAILCKRGPHAAPPALRWTALAAFLGVVAQAILGGLRVIYDPEGAHAGSVELATTLRIIHGAFAQFELCLLVAVAALASPAWAKDWPSIASLRPWRVLAWLLVALIFSQLILGATMRHHGAGLAISTFPAAAPDGALVPAEWPFFIALHFAHSRAMPLAIGLLALAVGFALIGRARGDVRLIRPGALLVVLVIGQIALGIYIIIGTPPREPVHTTSHVVNGALLLATAVLLALRAGKAARAE